MIDNHSVHKLQTEQVQKPSSPEDVANSEWRATELTLSRLAHPRIKQQLVNILYQKKLAEFELYRDEEWGPCTKYNLGDDYVQGVKSGIVIAKDALAKVFDSGPHITKEQIEEEIDKEIEQVATQTTVEFSDAQPSVSAMTLGWKMPGTNERPNTEQLSAIEAHEKGHAIRHYEHLDKAWRDAFDLSNIKITPEDMETFRMRGVIDDTSEIEDKDAVEYHLDGYLFSANEIAERMSQLKNYFGFAADEEFTKEHLAYAREHYVADTGLDNGMTFFFRAITPETEERFLEIINTSGI